MSYILDALRRSQAERERERGQVPGLEARPVVPGAAVVDRGRSRWGLVVAAVLLALAAAALWAWRSTGAPASTTDAPATATAPTVAVAPAVPAAASGPLASPAGAEAPAAALPTVAPVAPPAPLPMVVSAPPAQPVDGSLPAPPPAVAAPATAAPPAASAPAAPAAVLLSALTPEQRRDLPPLVMGGSIWSDNALSRFVIINGQVVREGEVAAPGVTVERIGPKAVWLRWRTLRLEVPI